MPNLSDLVRSLAIIRKTLGQKKLKWKIIDSAHKEANKDLIYSIKDLTAEEERLMDQVRIEGLESFKTTGEAAPGTAIKHVTTIVIDRNLALEWAKKNMSIAIRTELDEDMIMDFAKTHPQEAAVFIVSNEKVPTVTIDKDLSKFVEDDFIEEIEAQADADEEADQ